jgi:hypothetical protein
MKLKMEGKYEMFLVTVGCGFVNVIQLSQDIFQLQELR